MDDLENQRVRRARGLSRPHDDDNRIPPEKRGMVMCAVCKGACGLYVKPDPAKLAVFQTCTACGGKGEFPKMAKIPVKVRRIMDLQRWDATIPRERVEQIAQQKSVQVLWNEPFAVEVTQEKHGRGILTFAALLPNGKKSTIFEVLDVSELEQG